LKIQKGKSEAVYQRIDNTMNKEGQAMIYNILHIPPPPKEAHKKWVDDLRYSRMVW
jgi:hypothetical protein